MVVARVLNHLLASSQLLAAPQEVMVVVLRTVTIGSPRRRAMVPSLARVDNSNAKDSSKAPIIILFKVTDSRTGTTVVV